MSSATTSPDTSSRSNGGFWLVSLCFFLSGMAGLTYQMVWMRYLSTAFGTSELAIVAVLVAYMGGLAAGSWIAANLLHRLRRPVLVYALLELLIALSAIAVPLLLKLAGSLHSAILGGQAQLPADGGIFEALANVALACMVLFIPTACMGATLPILAKGLVARRAQIGRRIGWLYALNTFGAVAGTLVAAFLLIPSLGLWRASFFGVALNLLVAALGWGIARRVEPVVDGDRENKESDPGKSETAIPSPSPIARIVLVVMFASGAIAFIYEVLWARLLSHLLGGSFYSFAAMLAAFLIGIAIGGLVGAALARDARRSCLWLAIFEVATGLLTAVIFAIVGSGNFGEGGAPIFAQAMTCILVLTPATICLGATFPLAVRCLSREAADAGKATGRVYAWNTVGAIAGAVAAGLVIIPAIGYAATFKWAITTNLLLGFAALIALRPIPARGILAGAGVAVCAFALIYQPGVPEGLLVRSPVKGEEHGSDLKLVHLATGRSATVAVLERRGSLVIRSNGLQEAEIFPRGAESLSYTHIRWLPALPMALNPGAKKLLVVGFGGGALLESVPPGFTDVDVVEIEEEVVEANRLIAPRRAIDPLADPRLNIVINDARGALKLSRVRYDAIVSQPSHPWTAGASHLYTQEFLQLASEHLEPGGVFLQWLGSSFVDETLLGSFCAAALEVFPHLQLYLISDNFVIVASDQPLDPRLWSAGSKGSLFGLTGYPKLSYLEDLLAVLQLDEAGCRELAEKHPPLTDDRNLMATHHLPGKDFAGALNQPANLTATLAPLHYLNRPPGEVRERLLEAGTDLRYLTQLLKSSPPSLDRKKFYTSVLSNADRQLAGAAGLIATQPDRAASELGGALALGADKNQTRDLTALARFNAAISSWPSRRGGELPREFDEFVKNSAALEQALAELGDEGKDLLRTRYLAGTGQLEEARQDSESLAEFNDHRSPWFEPAYQLRLMLLTDTRDKDPAEIENDREAAVELLDQLLALPLERNLPLVRQRIAFAHHFGDFEFLQSISWIMATKIKRLPTNAPAATRNTFGQMLGIVFAPYLSQGTSAAKPAFDRPAMADLYHELTDEIGAGAIVFPKKGE